MRERMVSVLFGVLALLLAPQVLAVCPAGPPSLLGPMGEVPFGIVTLEWSSVPDAMAYEVYMGLDGDPLSLHGTLAAPQTTKNILVEPGRYVEWKVVAKAPSCPDQASDHGMFETSCPDVVPILQSPETAQHFEVGQPIEFNWTPVPGAAGYDLNVTPDFGQTFEIIAENITQTSFITDDLPAGDWGWYVRANFNGDCEPAFSQPSSFLISSCSTERTENLEPENGATGVTSPVTFRWVAIPDAEKYTVFVSTDGGTPRPLETTTETELTAEVAATNVVWVVQTHYANDCPPTFSEPTHFTLAPTNCDNGSPQPIAPANGATGVSSPATFQWSAVPGAIGYGLFVAINDDDPDSFELYGITEETELERFVPEGAEVFWFIVARFAGCDDVRSEVFRFTVGERSCGDPELTLNVPPDGAEVTSPVTLSWNPVPNAVMYRVLVTTEEGGTVVIERTAETQATIRFPAGEIRWRVEALRGNDCEPVLSEERTFVVREAANCASNTAPTLISPVGTAEQPAAVQSPVTLHWNAVANAIAYRIWMAGEDQPFGEVGFTRETQETLEIEPGKHAWFVSAIFEGCEAKSSPVAFFVVADTEGCSTDAPDIIAPAAGAVVDTPVTFVWTPVAGAVKYRVLAQVQGEGPFILGATEETELTVLLPPSDEPGDIVYLVQAVFDDCPSTESPRTPITVRRAQNCGDEQPELVSPPNGATNVEPLVDFVWEPVIGAVKYAVLLESNEGAETLLGITEDTQLTHAVPPGTNEWSVLAFVPGCDPVRSETFEFQVARPQNCATRKPVLLYPRGEVSSPVHLAWTAVPNAIGYRVRAQQGEDEGGIIAETTEPQAVVELAQGHYDWSVDALFESCPPSSSAEGEFTVGAPVPCGTPEKPRAQVLGRALSGTPYRLRWTALPNVDVYEVQESTTEDFSNAQTFTTDDLSVRFEHEVTGQPVQYLYRVRGVSNCNDERGPYSDVVGVYVIAAQTNNSSAELGEDEPIQQRIFVPGGATPQTFAVATDKPWLTVSPSSGALPAEGVTLTVTANPRVLPIGTNTGTISIQKTTPSGAGDVTTDDTTTTSTVPFSVSLVTPVQPAGAGTPPPDALIFGAVGHAAGQNDSLFESDIRLTNLTAQTMQYELHFTPSGTNGTQNGITGSIEVAPSSTIALDDVVASMFGEGTVGSAVGMLEVRPTTAPSSGGFFGGVTSGAEEQFHTVASSRTYNFTPSGTFGQFIPATRFADFVGRGVVLLLQQVAQSEAYRANFGFLEASGNPVDMVMRVYDTGNTLLATIPVSLQAMEHRQLNLLLAQNGITDLTDGRVEVEVTNGEGKVTAYVSEVDNQTSDPLLVSAEVKGARTSNRYVLPGIGNFRSGSAYWVSDARIFNAGTAATTATLTFYPMGNPEGAITREVTIDAGEIEVLNNPLANLFGLTGDVAGSLVISTPTATQLSATARTYSQTENGTFGQYIPSVTPAESVGVDDRALQILQVEQSSRFRTNIGVNETTGQQVTIEASLITPDSLTTPVVTMTLRPNEFRQFGLVDFHPEGAVYNGRVTIKVIGGTGKVTAYGSAIDSITQDPTYVPAQ